MSSAFQAFRRSREWVQDRACRHVAGMLTACDGMSRERSIVGNDAEPAVACMYAVIFCVYVREGFGRGAAYVRHCLFRTHGVERSGCWVLVVWR